MTGCLLHQRLTVFVICMRLRGWCGSWHRELVKFGDVGQRSDTTGYIWQPAGSCSPAAAADHEQAISRWTYTAGHGVRWQSRARAVREVLASRPRTKG